MSKTFLVPIDMNGLEIQNFLAHNLASAPTGVAGKVYFNTADHKLYYHNGTSWVDVTANLITGVKGNAESTYRTGNVNITPANVGAAPTSHASSATTYGMGTDANYGHLKLSDSTSSTAAAASGGTAATPKAVKDSLDAAKAYADGIVAASDAMVFKGTLGRGGTITDLPTTGVKIGDTYRVIEAGTYGDLYCEIGDLVIAIDTTPEWTVAQTNITGINKTTASIGSASTGTAIAADDITAWSAGTLPKLVAGESVSVVSGVTKTTGTAATASYSNGILTITDGSTPVTNVSSSSTNVVQGYTFSTGTLPSLSYIARSIPNISVTNKTVVTDVAFTTD